MLRPHYWCPNWPHTVELAEPMQVEVLIREQAQA